MKKDAQLTKVELAAALDIDVFSAEELLDGTIGIKMSEIFEIAGYMGMTPEEILNANPGLRVLPVRRR